MRGSDLAEGVGTATFVYLRSSGCSLLLEVPALDAAGTSPLPRVVHWGPALDEDVDAAALVLATSVLRPEQAMVLHLTRA